MEIRNGKAYINGKTISKAPLKDLLSLSPSDIGKLTKAQTIALEKRYMKAATGRMKTIKKQGLTSYAAEAYLGAEIPKPSTNKSTIYSVKHKVTILKEFLNAKTSTAKGIKAIYKSEETRIFGDGKGFQSEDERKRFWQAYMEFMHQNPRYYDQSTRIQQFLGRETFWRKSSFTAGDLTKLLVEIQNDEMGVDIRADAGYEPSL